MSKELKVYLILLILILPFLGSYIGTIVLSFLTNDILRVKVQFSDMMAQLMDSLGFLFIFLAIPFLTWVIYLFEKNRIKDSYYMLIPILMALSGFAAIYFRILYLNRKFTRFIIESNFEQRINTQDIHSIRFMIIGILACFITVITISKYRKNKKTNAQHTI